MAANASENATAGGMKLRSDTSRRNVCRVVRARRRAGSRPGSVSGSHSTVPTSRGTPIAARTMKTPRHDVIASSWPPTSGANTGATPVTSISIANTRAAAAPTEQIAYDRAGDDHAGAAE